MKIKTQFTKTQIKTMLVLGAVAVVMLIGALTLSLNAYASAGAPLPEHDKQRTARPSLSPHFNREINIGGSGNENLSDVFTVDDKIFVFGSTDSDDYDLDGDGGVFLALINSDGSTNAFFQYGERGDRLIKAALYENGFLLAVNNESGSYLLSVGFDGESAKTADTSGFSSDRAVDLKCYESRAVVVLETVNKATHVTNLKVRAYDYNLNKTVERVFAHACSADYIDMFEDGSDDYIIAVNLVSQLINRLAFIRWGTREQGLFYDIDLGTDGGYFCHGVMPYERGFIAVIVDEKKICDIITVTDGLTLHSRVYLKQSSVSEAKLFYAPDGYYCLLRRSRDVSAMVKLTPDLQYEGAVPQFATVNDVHDNRVFSDSVYFLSGTSGGLRLLNERGGELISDISFGGELSENGKLIKNQNRFVVVCEAERVCDDCPSLFGGKDIWLCFLNNF